MNEEQIVDEAARWMVHLQDDPMPAALTEFAGWLLASGDHVHAYLRLSRIWLNADLSLPVRPEGELLGLLRERNGSTRAQIR
jgi:ferric-dicitrate binding protein FerR (iron transport regulator)